MTDQAPSAKPLTRLSPSSFETLLACPLRLAFATQGHGGGSISGDRQRIGQVCHDVLESLVRDGELQSGSWSELLESRFLGVLARHEDETQAALRGSRLAMARLRKVAARMANLLLHVPPDAEILTEEELTAEGGRLYGRLDLIVRSSEMHIILDYKTGSFREPGTDQLKASYERQLMLYACLEAEASGAWPEEALLVPFGAEPVTLRVDPGACQRLLQEVLSALEEWQTWVGAPPPANPRPETCGWCPFAAKCLGFWGACTPDWKESLIAARGRVVSSATTPLGGTTFSLDSVAGSVIGTVVVRNVASGDFPMFATLKEGRSTALVGLRADQEEGVFTLWPGARIVLS